MAQQRSNDQPRVFISHAWENKKLVRRVERELLKAGAQVWVDHNDIRGGEPISARIGDGLQWCNVVLLIWSQAAEASEWVKQEWGAANSQHKKIIPCILDDIQLPPLLADQAYVDLRNFGRAIAELRRALRLPPLKPNSVKAEEEIDETSDHEVAVKKATKEIELHIDRDFENFSSKEKEKLLDAIRELLGITEKLRITQIRRGSVRMTLELTPEQAEKLYWAAKAGALDDHGVIDATILENDELNAAYDDTDNYLLESNQVELGSLDFDDALIEPDLSPSQNILSENNVNRMLRERDYFDLHRNREGRGVRHQYEVIKRNGQKLVIDHATGLTWQQGGSDVYLSLRDAHEYIQKLNREKFAGYNDWRLPTLEEAMSLMEAVKKNDDLFIDPVFDKKQRWIWTADKQASGVAWYVLFGKGYCSYDGVTYGRFVRAVRSGQ